MLKNVSLLLKIIDNSQETYCNIKEAERYNSAINHVAIFHMELAIPPVPIKTGLFPIEKSLYQNGLIIANSMEVARFLKDSIAEHKVIYIWELDWMFDNANYFDNLQVLQSGYKIICPSEWYATAIENYANIRPEVSEFSLEKIYEICSR